MKKKSQTPPNGEILLYQAPDGTTKLNVRLVNESVWLSIDQMALLFGVDKSGISRHLKNIFATGELVKPATVANFATVAAWDNSPSSNMFLICLEIVDLSL